MQTLNNVALDQNLSRYGLVALVIFGIGCGVSNSLVSLGAPLWSFYVIYWLIQKWRREGLVSSICNDKVLVLGLTYVGFTLTFLLILAPAEKWGRELGSWLLFLYWVISFGKSDLKLSASRLLKVDRFVGVAYFALWAICLYQQIGLGIERVDGVHNNPNRLACAILPPLVYFGERILRGAYQLKNGDRVFFALLWLVVVHMVFMTGTRSIFPFAMIYVVSFAWRLAVAKSVTIKKRTFALGLLASAVALFALTKSATVSRFDLSRLASDGNVLSRIEFWRINWNMFLESPIWGTGFRQNLLNVADHPGLQPYMDISGMHFLAHSTYVQVLTESGIVGFVLFFAFLGTAFFKHHHFRWMIFSIMLVGIADTSIHLARTIPAMIFFATLMGYAAKLEKNSCS